MADPTPHIVLVGLPGAGKSVVGRRLARSLHRSFVDLDAEIVRRANASVAELFASMGEEGFRSLEHAATAEVASRPALVLAPGGGWITRADTVALIRGRARLVYLKASVATVIRQMGVGIARRPLLAGDDPAGRLERLLEERRPAYESADIVIDVDHVAPQEVTKRIVAWLPASELRSAMPADAGS